jgi:hypothetical protein
VVNVTQATPGETGRDKAAVSPPLLADSQSSAMTIVGEEARTTVPFKRKSSR